MDERRLRRYQLTCELAFEIMTADDPAQARQQHLDDLTDELLSGRANLEANGPLREAFRDAMGYSRRAPDGRGTIPGSRRASSRPSGDTPGEDSMVAHGEPVPERKRVGLRLVDGSNP
jgi:hypothetical protein